MKHFINMGTEIWEKQPKINKNLFILTYGSLVNQLINKNKDLEWVNLQLYSVGNNIGLRIADDFFAKTGANGLKTFFEAIEMIVFGFFMAYFGVTPQLTYSESNVCIIEFNDESNFLEKFIIWSDEYEGLNYSIIYCGFIDGILDVLNLRGRSQIISKSPVTIKVTEI